jgi:hypothetical protein
MPTTFSLAANAMPVVCVKERRDTESYAGWVNGVHPTQHGFSLSLSRRTPAHTGHDMKQAGHQVYHSGVSNLKVARNNVRRDFQ